MKKKVLWMVVAGCGVCLAGGVKYVDEFDVAKASCGMGRTVQARKSLNGNALSMGGTVYERGIGTRPESAVGFALTGDVTAFDAVVGIDAEAGKLPNRTGRKAGAIFRVWVDGKVALTTGTVLEKDKPRAVHVDLKGAKEVVLETASYAPWCGYERSHADWADARFTLGDGAAVEMVSEARHKEQWGILTPPEKPEPRFNGADIWGVRPGHPVIFRVPVSGARPMKFTAAGVPAGVTFDAAKGILGGTAPEKKGDYDITVTAENAHGTAMRVIRLAVGDTICLTPPMGWNSWNVWAHRLTQEHACASARAMEESGLGNYGWSYINLDDWWEMNNSDQGTVKSREKYLGREDVKGPARDAEGRINPNRSFPDMKAFTDYVHSFGFKAGLYSSPGPLTCGSCEGSYGHEPQDARSWADWGFDYVKYDWCSYGEIYKKETGDDTWNPKTMRVYSDARAKPYRLMGDCLRQQNRDIVYSFCQYGLGKVELWGREAGAQCWRSWQDMKDTWTWMEVALEGYVPNADFWKYTGPGFWADPDMMIVGQQHSFGSDHPTYLTPNEQYTHVSLWAMVCSPLLTGCDLTKLDAFTRSLLVNGEVIAISQDRLGRPAKRVRHTAASSVWTRPLANGDVAVALVNRYPLTATVSFTLAEAEARAGAWIARDCWRQADLAEVTDAYACELPPHATRLVRLRRK